MTFLVLAVLAFAFAFLMGFSAPTLLLGLGVAFLVLVLLPQLPARGSFGIPALHTGARLARFGRNLALFALDFLRDLTMSNIVLALDVWTPRDYYRPRLIEVPVGDLTPMQIALLSTRITLTPGTLSVDVTDDQAALIVHSMYPGPDAAAEAARLRRPIDILCRDL